MLLGVMLLLLSHVPEPSHCVRAIDFLMASYAQNSSFYVHAVNVLGYASGSY